MLNLEELEAKLDAALAAETEESLTRWLFNKRASDLSFLGSGKLVSYRPFFTTFKPAGNGKIEFKNVEKYISLDDYMCSIAA